jgi:hypothetical protein
MTSIHKIKYKNTSPTEEKLCIGMKCNNQIYFFRYINYRILFLLENQGVTLRFKISRNKLRNIKFQDSVLMSKECYGTKSAYEFLK